MVKVTRFALHDDWEIELAFSDGTTGRIDFRGWFSGREGLLRELDDLTFFRGVQLDPESGTLVWPNGVDLCPDVLQQRATGRRIPWLVGGNHAA
jgi:hypothetical protein